MINYKILNLFLQKLQIISKIFLIKNFNKNVSHNFYNYFFFALKWQWEPHLLFLEKHVQRRSLQVPLQLHIGAASFKST